MERQICGWLSGPKMLVAHVRRKRLWVLQCPGQTCRECCHQQITLSVDAAAFPRLIRWRVPSLLLFPIEGAIGRLINQPAAVLLHYHGMSALVVADPLAIHALANIRCAETIGESGVTIDGAPGVERTNHRAAALLPSPMPFCGFPIYAPPLDASGLPVIIRCLFVLSGFETRLSRCCHKAYALAPATRTRPLRGVKNGENKRQKYFFCEWLVAIVRIELCALRTLIYIKER